MKKFLLFICVTCFFFKSFSQSPLYGNEWINYSQQYFKIKIEADGLYRISYSTLLNSGIPLSTINGNQFQIFGRGQEVPIYVSTNSVFTTNDYIEFYALKNDGSLDSNLYADPTWQGNVRLSLFNDTASYFLTWNSSTNNQRLVTTPNNISGHPPKETWCWFKTENIYGQGRYSASQYCKGKPMIQGQPIFDSDLSPGEGYVDGFWTHSALTKTLYTPYPYIAGPAAKFNAGWEAKFPGAHYLELSVSGTLQQVYNYNDFTAIQTNFNVTSNNLIGNGTTDVTFSTSNSPTSYDNNGIAYLSLKYPRTFNSDNSSKLMIYLDASAANKYLEFYNFNEQGTTPVLYDFTNGLRLTAQISNDTLKFLLPPSSNERQLLLIAQTPGSDIQLVDTLTSETFTDYSVAANQGNFIIISNPYFYDDGAGNNYVQQYKDFKNSTGYTAIIANINELYDQFSYGVEMHPIAIRNFSRFIADTWDTNVVKHIFLIGKGIEFINYNDAPVSRAHNYVPTFGWPGSDVLLTATNDNPVPRISIGRIPVLTTNDIKNYLEKAQQFIVAQNAPQTIEDKLWMKRVLHLGGGENLQDQTIFQYYLDSYKPIIEDTLFGGKVTSFFKTSSDPISSATSSELDSLINTGVTLINFFGHSSYNSFDFNLDHPEDYTNYGKYPMIISNGCLLGNLFYDGTGLSDEFVFAHNAGAIAFLAAATFSISNSLDVYTHNFYNHLSFKSYEAPIGTLIKNAIDDIWTSGNATGVDRTVFEQMGLNGDPSLKLNTHPLPDYVIEPNSVSFTPGIVSAGVDSFAINLVISNIGRAIDDSFYVDITRIYPSGQQYPVAHRKVHATYYQDTIVFNLKTDALTALGLNQFNIHVESEHAITEMSETNNDLTVDLLILSDDIVPIYPYEFSIVNHQGVTLKASTVNAFAAMKQYVFQIDTTENFNSPLFQQTHISQIGGLAKWTPVLTLHDSTVYYWRTSLDTLYNNGFSWHNSSFIYLNGSSPGWNQSHYFQYLKDKFGSIELPSNRIFKYSDDLKTIGVYNGVTTYYNGPLGWDEPSYFINNVRMANWTCGTGANIMFAVIDSLTGVQWESVNQGTGYGQYGNIHCWPGNLNAFYFDGTSPSMWPAIEQFIDTIPNGDYVLAMSMNDAGVYNWDTTMENAFATIGGIHLDTLSVTRPFVLFCKKGSSAYPMTEIIGDTFTSIIDTNFVIQGAWDRGFIETPLIGPASSWTSLHWKYHQIEANMDSVNLSLIGVNNAGIASTLSPTVLASDTSINGLDASLYPYVKLRIYSQDTTWRTPAQLDFWRVNYQGVPEAALNPAAYLSFEDTVNLYGKLKLDCAVENVSEYDMDSINMKYTITDVNNQPHVVYDLLDSLRANDTLHTSFVFPVSSSIYNGLNSLVIETNPYGATHQLEQYHFNNLGSLRFFTDKDLINPYINATFDGVQILDGDLVSAKPNINIQFKDNNTRLLLNDTSLLKVQFIYPDGSTHKIIFDGSTNIFHPADATQLNKSNNASAELNPDFSLDGIYHLIIQGYDRSGNASGDYAFQVSFEVINKQMVSNVLNYPNPFTTQTHFVFTLTGSEVPDFIKIQIMTVSGKVVREIYKDELGPLHIGRNITEFVWDGTDQYGDALANGLYIYRVTAKTNGENIDKYDTGTDQYFKHGFGKMYLLR